MSDVRWGASEEAFKALHDSMQNLMAIPPGKKITKLAFTWTAGGNVETIKAYDGAGYAISLKRLDTTSVSGCARNRK